MGFIQLRIMHGMFSDLEKPSGKSFQKRETYRLFMYVYAYMR